MWRRHLACIPTGKRNACVKRRGAGSKGRGAGTSHGGFEPWQQRAERRVGEVPLLPQAHPRLLEAVGRRKQQRKQLGIERHPIVPCPGQQVFEPVAGLLDEREIHRARGSLQAMRRPEKLLEPPRPLGLGRVFLQGQRLAVQRAHVLLELVEECVHQPRDELGLIHGVGPLRTV